MLKHGSANALKIILRYTDRISLKSLGAGSGLQVKVGFCR